MAIPLTLPNGEPLRVEMKFGSEDVHRRERHVDVFRIRSNSGLNLMVDEHDGPWLSVLTTCHNAKATFYGNRVDLAKCPVCKTPKLPGFDQPVDGEEALEELEYEIGLGTDPLVASIVAPIILDTIRALWNDMEAHLTFAEWLPILATEGAWVDTIASP